MSEETMPEQAMSEETMSEQAMPEQAGDWLKFWLAPWQCAHPDWLQSLPESHFWSVLSPLSMREQLDLAEVAPPYPGEVAEWLMLSPEARKETLLTAAEVVETGICQHCLDEKTQVWCQRLSRALAPWKWIRVKEPDPQLLGLALMRQWLSAEVWKRIRLLFPVALIQGLDRVNLNLNADDAVLFQRLDRLWHGVIWHQMLISRSWLSSSGTSSQE